LGGNNDLWDFLASPVWPGTVDPREGGTVLLFFQDGKLKAMLNDKAQGQLAFLVLDVADDLLVQVDVALASPDTDWRKSRASPPAKK
jgi:hypothetical protein